MADESSDRKQAITMKYAYPLNTSDLVASNAFSKRESELLEAIDKINRQINYAGNSSSAMRHSSFLQDFLDDLESQLDLLRR